MFNKVTKLANVPKVRSRPYFRYRLHKAESTRCGCNTEQYLALPARYLWPLSGPLFRAAPVPWAERRQPRGTGKPRRHGARGIAALPGRPRPTDRLQRARGAAELAGSTHPNSARRARPLPTVDLARVRSPSVRLSEASREFDSTSALAAPFRALASDAPSLFPRARRQDAFQAKEDPEAEGTR